MTNAIDTLSIDAIDTVTGGYSMGGLPSNHREPGVTHWAHGMGGLPTNPRPLPLPQPERPINRIPDRVPGHQGWLTTARPTSL